MKRKNQWYQKEVDEMLNEVISIKKRKDLKDLFDRVLTPREINDISRRLKGCHMLAEGKSYTEIRESIGLSDTVIAKLSTKIGYGFRRGSTDLGSSLPSPKRVKKTIIPNYKRAPGIKI